MFEQRLGGGVNTFEQPLGGGVNTCSTALGRGVNTSVLTVFQRLAVAAPLYRNRTEWEYLTLKKRAMK